MNVTLSDLAAYLTETLTRAAHVEELFAAGKANRLEVADAYFTVQQAMFTYTLAVLHN